MKNHTRLNEPERPLTEAARRPALRVGDTVMWRGGWGADPARPAVVTFIGRMRAALPEDADPVESVTWAELHARPRAYIVDLDCGRWAYGFQIDPISEGKS